jgi:hypothetical protein
MKNTLSKFDLRELIGSLIIIGIGLTITIFFGWIISAIMTTIFAFFFFRFIGSLKFESRMNNFCKNCGEKMSWIQQYSKHYCHYCQKYSPICPSCGKDLFWIRNYGRYYCNDCRKYVEIQDKDYEKSDNKRKKSRKKPHK